MQHAILTNPATTAQLAALEPWRQVFFGYLADYSGKTRDLYEYYLNRFLTWCEAYGIDPLSIDRTHVALYVNHLTDDCGLRGSTVNTAFVPIKGMFKWALLEGFIDRDPAVHVRLPKADYRSKYPLERDELKRFRAAAKELGGRHWALGELLTVHALRISETTGLLIENCQQVERGHRVMSLRRKGGKWSTIPMPVVVQLAIDAAAGDRTSGPVLTRVDGGPLTRGGATGLVQTIVKRAGIARQVNPHLVRGSVVTDTVEREGIREGQRLADHEDPRTTSRHYDLSKKNHDTHPSHIVSARFTV